MVVGLSARSLGFNLLVCVVKQLLLTSPVEVSDLDDATGLSVGGGYVRAVTAKKTVKCWGNTYAGTMGIAASSGPQTCTTGAAVPPALSR